MTEKTQNQISLEKMVESKKNAKGPYPPLPPIPKKKPRFTKKTK